MTKTKNKMHIGKQIKCEFWYKEASKHFVEVKLKQLKHKYFLHHQLSVH